MKLFKIRLLMVYNRFVEKLGHVLFSLSRTVWPLTLLRRLSYKVQRYSFRLGEEISNELRPPSVKVLAIETLESVFCSPSDEPTIEGYKRTPAEVKEKIISVSIKRGGCEVQNGVFRREDCTKSAAVEECK